MENIGFDIWYEKVTLEKIAGKSSTEKLKADIEIQFSLFSYIIFKENTNVSLPIFPFSVRLVFNASNNIITISAWYLSLIRQLNCIVCNQLYISYIKNS